MTRWDTDNLNAAHTQRELDQECGGDGVIDLVKRLRDEAEGAEFSNRYADLVGEAGDKIEQLERELTGARGLNYDLRQNIQDQSILRESFEAELDAEKALADELEKVAHGVSWGHPARAAYRKARGL